MAAELEAALIAGVVSLIGSAITLVIARTQAQVSEAKMRQESAEAAAKLKLDNETLLRQYQLEFATERVARELMMDKEWRLRSFDTIKHHLSGFGDDELRKILVRAGAISFTSRSGVELWGLLDRNRDRLGANRVQDEPGTRMVTDREGVLTELAGAPGWEPQRPPRPPD